MNIYKWLQEAQDELRAKGETRLALLLSVLPTYVCNDEHARVAAIYPEALALAKQQRNPWLEIFVRHWGMQHRITRLREAADSLSDAVSLVEFSHREGNIDCPQSVCTTQDLSIAYYCLDGPGYANERLELARETLARINAKWPCFMCITTEYAEALLDLKRYEEVLEFLDRQDRELVAAAAPARERARSHHERFRALFELGRIESALAVSESALAILDDDEHEAKRANMCRCIALCHLGRVEEAANFLPPPEAILPTVGYYDDYLWALEMFASRGGVSNGAALSRLMGTMFARLRHNGVYRQAFDAALRLARLTHARGRPGQAGLWLDQAEQVIPRLRAPLDAPSQVEALRTTLRDAASPTLPDTVEGVLEAEYDNPDEHLEWLLVAIKKWPEHAELRIMLCDLLHENGLTDLAIPMLRPWRVEDGMVSARRFALLGQMLYATDRHAELDTLVAEVLPTLAEPGHGEADDTLGAWAWLLAARASKARQQEAQARHQLERALQYHPQSVSIRVLLGRTLLEEGEAAAGADLMERLARDMEAPGPWDWELMLCATACGRWTAMRDAAVRLELPVEAGDEPINERWGGVRVRLAGSDGATRDWFAVRTGPVTAQVIEIAEPGLKSHYLSVVLFDPSPLVEPDEERVGVFPGLLVLAEEPHSVYGIDGIHPDEERLEQIRAELFPMRLQVMSNPQYRLPDPAAEETLLQGFYGFLAVPQDVPLKEAHIRLAEATRDWPHPLLWPQLAQDAGLQSVVKRHLQLARRYGIEVEVSEPSMV